MTMSSGDWGATSSEDTERSSSSARDRKRDAAAATHAGRLALLYAMSRGADPEASRAPQAALLASATKWISEAGQPPQAGGGGNRHAARGATSEVRRGEASIALALEDSREEVNRRITPRTGKGEADRAATSEDQRRETDREATPEARRGEADRQLTGAATQPSRGAESQSAGGSSLKSGNDPYTDALTEAHAFTQTRIQEANNDLLQQYPLVLVQELPVRELTGDRNLLQIRNKINEANATLHNLERRLQDLRTGTTNPIEEENRRKRRAITGKIRQVANQYSDRWVIREKLQQELQRLVGCAEHPDIEDNIWLCTRAIRETSKAIREEDMACWQYRTERRGRQATFRTRGTATQGNEQRDTTDPPRGPLAGAEAVGNLTDTSRVLGGRAWSRSERPITDDSRGEHGREGDKGDDDRKIFPTKIFEKRAKRRSITKLSMPENAETGAAGKAKAATKGKAKGKRGVAGRSGDGRESGAARGGAAGRTDEVRVSSAARGGAAGARATPRSTAAAGKNAGGGGNAGPSAVAGGAAERRMRGSGAGESLTAGLAAGGGGEIGVAAEGDATVAESAGEDATALDHAAPPGQAPPPMAHSSSAGHGLPAEGLPAAGNSGFVTAASSQLPPLNPRSPDRGRKRRNPERSTYQL